MRKCFPAASMLTDWRMRWLRGCAEVQTRQRQPTTGTPVDVPVPRKVTRIGSAILLDGRGVPSVFNVMMRRALLALVLLSMATTAAAAWYPVFDPTYVRVEVGETRWVRVRTVWTGTMIVPWSNWYFGSTHPLVAHIDDVMVSSATKDIAVTGVAPGEAGLFLHGYALNRPYVAVDVVCGVEPAIANATPEVRTVAGRAVTLRVETPIAHRTAFAWYRGENGDTSRPLAGEGPQLTWAPPTHGKHQVWVRATTPCSTSAAGFVVEALPPRQRAARR